MKKKLILILGLLLALTSVPTCLHVHDETCGYNEETNSGCEHVHDDECGYIDPLFEYDPDNPHG